MKTPQPACPECEKLSAVAEKSNIIGEFLDWMIENTDYRLCAYYNEPERYENGYLSTSHRERENLLAEYFNIDIYLVEQERRALLEWLRQEQE